MTKKKTIFVNRFFYPDHSATAQMLSDLAFRLAKNGYQVLVVTTTGHYHEHAPNMVRHEVVENVDIHRVYQPRFGRARLFGRAVDYLLMYFFFAKAVYGLARAGDLIVAKTDPPMLSVALLPVCLLRQAKLVNWLQDLYPEVATAFGIRAITLLSPILKPLRDMCLKKARHSVVIGDQMKDRLLSLAVQAEHISTIHNWCEDELIRPLDRSRNALRRSWGLDEKFVVAYSGNLGRAHEFETIVEAAELLKDETNLVFLFIGGGALTPQLKDEVAKRRLGHLFQFRPYQALDTLSVSLTLPDIFWASLRPEMEGLCVPSKFYGSCAAGRPTIFVGDPDGEISRLVRDAECGAVIPIGEARRLAETILMFMQDKNRLEDMGRNARRLLEARFSKAQALGTWEQLICREMCK